MLKLPETLLGVPSDQSLFWVKAIIGDDKNAFLWLRVVKGQGTTDQWGCNCLPCLRLRSKRRIKWGNDFIYIGCQILSRSLFEKYEIGNFSISEVWNELLKQDKLNGFESFNKFYHLTNLETFKKLKDL